MEEPSWRGKQTDKSQIDPDRHMQKAVSQDNHRNKNQMTPSRERATSFYRLTVGHSVTGGLFIHLSVSPRLILVLSRHSPHVPTMFRLLHLVLLGLLVALALCYAAAAG